MSWLSTLKTYTGLSVYLMSFSLPAADVHVNVNVVGPACTVTFYGDNVDDSIEVDFGDQLLSTRLNGYTYKKDFIVTFACNAAVSDTFFIKIEGEQWETSKKLLKTSKENLSIKFFRGSAEIKVNTKIATEAKTYVFRAAPIQSGTGQVEAGPFTASATLVVYHE